MDRALKERITGAVVLVVIAVLVVPVFLDGAPTDAEMVTQTVTLPGQEEQRRKQQTIVLERDREQPVPAGSRRATPAAQPDEEPSGSAPAVASADRSAPPVASEPEPQAPAAQEQAPEPAKEDAQAPEPAKEEAQAPERVAQTDTSAKTPSAAAQNESATGMWAVQLGSFSNPDNAQRLASDLRTNGYAAFLSQLKTSDGALHRVRVGPQKDRDSAEAVAKRLSGDGHEGQVVPHP